MIPLKDNIRASQRFAFITFLIILINVIVFLYELTASASDHDQYVQYALFGGALTPLSLITYQFLHGGWIHLIGNMVYLWVFGNNVEDQLGHIPFLFFYLVSGVLGGLTEVLLTHSDTPLIGASAAVAGVLGAYIVWFPKAQVKVLLPIIIYWTIVTLPAILVLGLWFVTNLFNGYASVVASNIDNVAYLAHVGGFVFGAVVALLIPMRGKDNVITTELDLAE